MLSTSPFFPLATIRRWFLRPFEAIRRKATLSRRWLRSTSGLDTSRRAAEPLGRLFVQGRGAAARLYIHARSAAAEHADGSVLSQSQSNTASRHFHEFMASA